MSDPEELAKGLADTERRDRRALPKEVVLVVDDDDDIRTFLEVTLSLGGFEVVEATDGDEAVEKAIQSQPALILMDVMMPEVDGIEATEQLRRDGRTSHIPIILLTAKAQMDDKVEGFSVGADDYVTKPFDPAELVARVKATLRRSGQMRTMSPLTGLPGNVRIDQELARRIADDDDFAILYADLNAFKAVNDHYGPMRGDEVIKAFASICKNVSARKGTASTFVGHLGGDDFILVTGLDSWRDIASAICERFDERAPDYYDQEDLERGYIEVRDRRGVPTKYAPVSVSVGVATTRQRKFDHPSEAMEVATEMKNYAKELAKEGQSNWAVDRRIDEQWDEEAD